MDDNKTYFTASMDLDAMDEKLRRFIELRNELVLLAQEIGFEAKSGMFKLEKQ